MAEQMGKETKQSKHELLSNEQLYQIYDEVFPLYERTLGIEPKKLPLILLDKSLSPQQVKAKIIDSLPIDIPRGKVFRPIGVTYKGDIEIAGQEEIVLVVGNPDRIRGGETAEIYKHILVHESVHAQIALNTNVEKKIPGLPTKYAKGFNIVSVVIEGGSAQTKETTYFLDEWVTQYFALVLTGTENELDSSLQAMKKASKGISSFIIEGAQLLHELFTALDLDSGAVFEYYRNSDPKGFKALLNTRLPELGDKLFEIAKADDEVRGLAQLRKMVNRSVSNAKIQGVFVPPHSSS